jgi:RNA polymerase sigma factor (sigma-70 family)
MTSAPVGQILQHLRKLTRPNGGELNDEPLLERFVADRDEAAFTLLVQRHGSMVLGVCRSVLRQQQDAEDVFQAAFLTLARKAGSIRSRSSLGPWLCSVAYHLAVKARACATRRHALVPRIPALPAADPLEQMTVKELRSILHEEIQQLPEKYRAPLILCHLEGKSHDEAAHLLGWPRRRVKGRLQRGRERLRYRLIRRGLSLPAGLLTTALAVRSVSAALRPPLLAATVRAVLASPGVKLPNSVASLVGGGRKVVAVLALAAGLLAAGASVLAQRQAPGQPPRQAEPPKGEASKPAPESALVEQGERVTLSSRVLGLDGKPFAGAEVSVWWYSHYAGAEGWRNPAMHSVQPRFGATSGADGRFRFSVTPREITNCNANHFSHPWRHGTLVAAAKGYGPAWVYVEDLKKGTEILRLVKDDVPIKGRVLDLQGRPVVGASVRVVRLKRSLQDYHWLDQQSWAGLSRGVTTDRTGRFTLTGVGRDRIAVVHVSGRAIETRVVEVSTRSAADAKVDLILGPTKVIEGTVRARDTGKPLAGVWLYGNEVNYCRSIWLRPIRARTDRQGRYRLVGLPKVGSYEVSVYPADGGSYLSAVRQVADSEGLKPLTADFSLRRGVPVRCRLLDKETGQLVRGQVMYEVAHDNPLRREADFPRRLILSREFNRYRGTDQDGFARFTAYPGAGVVFAVAGYGNPPYLLGRLRPEDETRGRFPLSKGDPANGFLELMNGYQRLDPDVSKDKLLTFDILLTRGRELKGTLLGPEGKPLPGATAFGVSFDASASRPDKLRRSTPLAVEKLKTDSFTARGVYPGEPRTLSFEHAQRKLIGRLIIQGTEKGPLVVRLQPWGALAGRLLSADGKPLAGVRVSLSYPSLPRPGMPGPPKQVLTDTGGRFRIEGLLPGLKHELTLGSSGTLKDLSAAAGQTRELGDVRPAR